MTPHAALTALPAPSSRPRTVAFTSGKGGVGKSSLALNTGILLARRGRRVAVLDGDLGLANLTVLLGQSPRYDLRHVVAGERHLGEVLLRGPEGLLVVPAGPGVAELANLPEAARGRLLAQLREVERQVDFLLIDTGAGISDTVLDLLAASDEALVVTQPEPTALADAYALMKVVVQTRPTYPFHVLVNMVRDERQGEEVFRALAQILGRFLGYRPGYAGAVVADPAVARAAREQVPLVVLAPAAPAVRCLERLAAQLCGAPAARDGRSGSFWARMLGRGGEG